MKRLRWWFARLIAPEPITAAPDDVEGFGYIALRFDSGFAFDRVTRLRVTLQGEFSGQLHTPADYPLMPSRPPLLEVSEDFA